MKADFSRGFNPDDKRGKRYRRVLLQQGRVLLDSDAVAGVEATDRLLREEARDLGTEAGGLRRGFLITAGHLLCLFDEAEQAFRASIVTPPSFRRIDYNMRFRQRFPSLMINAATAATLSVTITLERPHDTDEPLVVWLAADADSGTTIDVDVSGDGGGSYGTASVNITGIPDFVRFQLNATTPNATDTTITFEIDGNRRIWIGLIETGHTQTDVDPGPGTTLQPVPLWIQAGRYHLGGLMVETNALGPAITSPGEVHYPEQGFPRALGFDHEVITFTGTQGGVAYLEGWERMITALHDPGIRENALSSTLDTSVRTQAIGQVKTFVHPTGLSDFGVKQAFANKIVPNGRIVFGTHEVGAVADPCGITPEGGFTGRENLLYHFEIHEYASGTGRIKWSRQGGSELFGVVAYTTGSITVPASSPLRDGNIVELLNDEIELGDAAPGAIVSDQFRPPVRQVGVIAQLRAQASADPANNEFALVDPDAADTVLNIDDDGPRYGGKPPETLRVRRWDAFPAAQTIPTDPNSATPVELEIENGIFIQVAGTFEVGDWWQFEARFQANAVTPVPTRHGPERLFSPLALLGRTTASDLNPDVVVWLDDPFVPAAELDADHIDFDPIVAVMAGSSFDSTLTLQAMLDHLILFGPGQTISSRITHTWALGPAPGTVTGNWQLSVGDGVFSFGDFNEDNTNGVPNPSAIAAALNFVRTFSPGGPAAPRFTLRLFVKRGTYVLDPASPIILHQNERLILEGEGLHTDTTQGVASVIDATVTSMQVIDATASLEIRGITLIGGAGTRRFNGKLKLVGCRIVDHLLFVGGVVSGQPDIPLNEDALLVEDCEFQVFNPPAVEGISIFMDAVSQSVPCVTIRNCRALVDEDRHFVGIEATQAGCRFERLTIEGSYIELAGSFTDTTATKNAGLLQVRTSTAPDGALTIRDLIFENCNLRAGRLGPGGAPGVLLHLPSGNDPAVSIRANSIENVVIRGGRWTIVSNVQEDNAIYIGNNVYSPNSSADPRIQRVTLDGVAIGWEGESPVLYGSKFTAEHTILIVANDVIVRDVSFFGMSINSSRGEIAILGRQSASVDGLRMAGFRTGGSDTNRPVSRVRIISSGPGAVVRGIDIVGDIAVASGITTVTGGVIEVVHGGDGANPGRVTQLADCRASDNRSGAGFLISGHSELANCTATRCRLGVVSAAVNVAVRGGWFVANLDEGILFTATGRNLTMIVDGVTIKGNAVSGGQAGLVISPDFIIDTPDWLQRGPVVTNNRVFDNGDGTKPQIQLGRNDATPHNNIGGICMGNACTGQEGATGVIRVDTSVTYHMRGLGTQNGTTADVWAFRNRLGTPGTPPTSALAPLLFNDAIWARN
jgi:hypothetical protein